MLEQNNSNNKKYSILSNVHKEDIRSDPFPYIVIENALDQETVNALTQNFPLDVFQQAFQQLEHHNNMRYDLGFEHQKYLFKMHQQWQDFINFHVSNLFFEEFIEIFGDYICQINPNYFKTHEDLKRLRTGKKGISAKENADVFLDCYASINTPVHQKNSVRQMHVDNGNKLYSALLYLRPENDQDSQGGNLLIGKWKDEYTQTDKLKYYREGVDDKHFNVIETVKYDNNVCVIFLNSLNSLHAVTAREQTPHFRYFANFVGEMPYSLYEVNRKFSRNNIIKQLSKYNKKIQRNIRKAIYSDEEI